MWGGKSKDTDGVSVVEPMNRDEVGWEKSAANVSVERRPALHCIKGGLKLVETFQLSLLAIRHLINAHIQLATREAPGCSAGRRETQHSKAHRPTWVLVIARTTEF